MSWSDLVDRLSVLAGIEPHYFDIRGERHEATLATKVLVLEGLGLDVSSIPAVEAGLRAKEEEPWQRWMTPYLVEAADRLAIDVFLPADQAARTWRSEIVFENGGSAQRTFRPEQIALVGARDIHGARVEHRRLEFDHAVTPGYHRVRLACDESVESTLACVPAACYLPAVLKRPDRRVWGISAHLYTLRSERNWGVGDFGDLAALCELAGRAGASAVALNPFHALFPMRPDGVSPYSPSSRLFLNPLYIDVTSAPFAAETQELRSLGATLASLRGTSYVDYPKVWQAKRAAFEALFRAFQPRHGADGGDKEFVRFVAAGGKPLRRFAAFSALEEEYGPAWHEERQRYPAPDAPAVEQFARDKPDRILFHQYLQYLADRQLQAATGQAPRTGMEIGVVRDLALGVGPDGFDVWAGRAEYATALCCGAPPDDFNPHGQEWGVVPLNPMRLRQDFEPFATLLRSNMRHAGGLRIDHVIGLQRLFLVPLGGTPAEGCYVRQPLENILGILALESHRNACLVIGEDLGTVPEGFRDRMRNANIYGCGVLYFERLADGAFRPPGEYRVKAAASVTTHDLPTLAGYLEGRDCTIRREIGIYSDEEAEAALAGRRRDREWLHEALVEASLLGAGEEGDDAETDSEWRDAVHAFLASSAAQLFLAQMDDLLDEKDQLNVPGTTAAYPNWRRKLSFGVAQPKFAARLHALADICARHGRHRRAL